MERTYELATGRMIKTAFEQDGAACELTRIWNQNGVLTSERWRSRHVQHRADGPARCTWSDTGAPLSEMWYRHGLLHRPDGPALQQWNIDGQQLREWWRLDGHCMAAERIESILRPAAIMAALREGLPQPIYEEIAGVFRST